MAEAGRVRSRKSGPPLPNQAALLPDLNQTLQMLVLVVPGAELRQAGQVNAASNNAGGFEEGSPVGTSVVDCVRGHMLLQEPSEWGPAKQTRRKRVLQRPRNPTLNA